MAFNFSSTAGTSGITSITVSASSRQELTDIVENFTLSNTNKSLLMPIAQRAYEPLEKYIIFNPISMAVDSSGGTASLNIQSNDNWVITADDWIQLSRFSEPDRGPQSISGNGNTIVGIRFYENIGDARTGTISGYCTSDSSITATTTVSQAGSYVKPYITLDKYVVNIPSSGMSSQTITVESNIDWYTMSDSRWIDINTQSGSGNGTITFDVQESEQNIGRTGIITVSGVSESLSAECYVQQSAVTPSEPYIVISPTGKTIPLSGRSFTISVSSNTDWNVAIVVNVQSGDARTWLTVDKLNGIGDDVVEVTVNPMLSGTERTAYISFYNNKEGLKTECNITQKTVIEYVDYIFIDGGLATNPNNRIDIDYTPTQNTEFVLKGDRSDFRTNYATLGNTNIVGNGGTYKFGWYGYSRPNNTPMWGEQFMINRRSIDWEWYTWLDRDKVNATCGWFYIKDHTSGDTFSEAIEDPISVDVGSWKFNSLDIYESGTLVFSGVAAVVDEEIGIYDTISQKLFSNPNLTMTYQ